MKRFSCIPFIPMFSFSFLFVSMAFSSLQGADVPALKEEFASQFRIGVAVSPFLLRNEEISNLVTCHFNSVTAENCMKPEAIYRPDGNHDFTQADALVEFAKAHGMQLRGHTLVWHSQTPKTFFEDENGNRLDREALYSRLDSYIEAVMTHFGDTVYAWDVVNEAIADGGEGIYRTHSPWYEICGEDFIAHAFRTAHRVNPNAKLYYNDYGLINSWKREKTVKMLRQLLSDGVPVSGVGIQAHWSVATFNPVELQRTIDAFAELGLDVQITEMDMSVHSWMSKNNGEEFVFTPEFEQLQAEKYAEVFSILCRNADKISSVTFWGVADRYSWLNHFPVRGRADYPLLFDRELLPKKAFFEVLKVEK